MPDDYHAYAKERRKTKRNGLTKLQKTLYVAALACSILGALYGFGNFLFFSQSEGDSLKAEFLNHRDWGDSRYRDIIARLDKIDAGLDSLRFYRMQILYELKELNRKVGERGMGGR